MTSREAERSKNMFALGLMSWLYSRPTEGTIEFLEQEVREPARDRRGERQGLQRRLRVRRDDRGVRGPVRGRAGPARARHVPQHDRQPGARDRARRRERAERAAALPRRVPDHAGVRDPRGARRLQELRRPHVPGRGRDRGRRRGARRELRRRARRLARRAARASSSSRRRSGSRSRSSCRSSSSTSSARARRPGCRRSRSRPTCSGVLFGRNAESPVPVVAASTPGGCFDAAIEACRIALKYRTPVFLLSDAYLANGSEPWLDPGRRTRSRTSRSSSRRSRTQAAPSCPTSATPRRSRARGRCPGTPGLEHRIGGLEKADVTGNVSYDPDNHDYMVRRARAEGRGDRGGHPGARGRPRRGRDAARPRLGRHVRADRRRRAAASARRAARSRRRTSRYLNPFPRNLGDVLRSLRPRARPRDEPRPARSSSSAPSSSSTRSATTACAGCRSRSSELAEAMEAML